MGHHTTITSKGQMTLPKSVRDALNIKPGDKCYVWVRDGEIVIIPRNKSFRDMAGMLGTPPQGKGASLEDLQAAAGEEVVERFLGASRRDDGE